MPPHIPTRPPEHMDLNVGFKDQLEALRWIHREIESFGGDKTKVRPALARARLMRDRSPSSDTQLVRSRSDYTNSTLPLIFSEAVRPRACHCAQC